MPIRIPNPKGKRTVPLVVARCVDKVAVRLAKQGGRKKPSRDDVSRAHAICVAKAQERGELVAGTRTLTPKGRVKERTKRAKQTPARQHAHEAILRHAKRNARTSTVLRDAIVSHCARTLYVLDWADREERKGHSYPGEDLMEVAPPTPKRWATEARKLVGLLEQANRSPLEDLYQRAAAAPGKHYAEPTPEEFGFGIAMAAHGHGAGWWDNHPRPTPPILFPLVYV